MRTISHEAFNLHNHAYNVHRDETLLVPYVLLVRLSSIASNAGGIPG